MHGEIPTTAAEWMAKLARGPLSKGMQAKFELWLESDPQHQKEFALARITWLLSAQLGSSETAKTHLDALRDVVISEADEMTENVRAFPQRKWSLIDIASHAAAVMVLVVTGFLFWSLIPTSDHPRLAADGTAVTAINEIAEYELPDGSHLTVNADSALEVAFSSTERRVLLHRGQAFFEVQKDAKKPFVVAAGSHAVVVTGTKFDVKYDAVQKPVQVAVVEGRVTVGANAPHDPGSDAILSAGDAVVFSNEGARARLSIPPHLIAAWQARKLYFQSASLRDVLIDVNRYTLKPLILIDPALSELPMSGSFRAGDTDAVLFSLQAVYSIEPTDNGDVWLLQRKKPQESSMTSPSRK